MTRPSWVIGASKEDTGTGRYYTKAISSRTQHFPGVIIDDSTKDKLHKPKQRAESSGGVGVNPGFRAVKQHALANPPSKAKGFPSGQKSPSQGRQYAKGLKVEFDVYKYEYTAGGVGYHPENIRVTDPNVPSSYTARTKGANPDDTPAGNVTAALCTDNVTKSERALATDLRRALLNVRIEQVDDEDMREIRGILKNSRGWNDHVIDTLVAESPGVTNLRAVFRLLTRDHLKYDANTLFNDD